VRLTVEEEPGTRRREWLAAAPEGFSGDRDSHLTVAAGRSGNGLRQDAAATRATEGTGKSGAD
jgi:hypothetical protein